MKKCIKALIFDCDGVLVDTERDGHRVAFNRAFATKEIKVVWSIEEYANLLQVAGGKERMKYYFDKIGWPEIVDNKEHFIKEMHKLKTDIFMQIIETGELKLRSGIARLIDEAIAENIKLVVCSTSNERAVNLIVGKLLGKKRKVCFTAILAGDVVSKKKPDAEIYNLALKKLGVESDECVVVEDSNNGLLAAKRAKMNCIITTNSYSENEDFSLADLVVAELGDKPNINVTIDTIRNMV